MHTKIEVSNFMEKVIKIKVRAEQNTDGFTIYRSSESTTRIRD